MWVIAKKTVKSITAHTQIMRTSDGRMLVFTTEGDAEEYLANPICNINRHKYTVMEDRSEYYELFGRIECNLRNQTRPCYLIMERKTKVATKKTASNSCLVELYEDYSARKFAISSKANSEAEFITETSQVMAASGSENWEVRLKEVLPLIVDMACKYRGYKAETVFERRELVAGDLEMPRS